MNTLAISKFVIASARWKLISTNYFPYYKNITRPISFCIRNEHNKQLIFSPQFLKQDLKQPKNFSDFDRGFHTSNALYQKENQDKENDKENKKKMIFYSIATSSFMIGFSLWLLYELFPKNKIENPTDYSAVTWDQFVNTILISGEVKKIFVNPDDSHKAFVQLHPNAKLNGTRTRYKMIVNLKDNRQLENMLRKEENRLRIDPLQSIEVQYLEKGAPSLGLLLLMLAMLVTPLLAMPYVFGKGGKNIMKNNEQVMSKMGLVPEKILVKKTGIRFRNVAGLHEAKQEVKEFVDFLKNSKKYTKLGAKLPRGCLLSGPPGVGKTLLAKALATEAGVPFIPKAGSDFVELIGGLGAKRIRQLFETARKNSPSIIYIDELDAIGKERHKGSGGRMESANRESDQTLNQILVEMDGMLSSKHQVIILASTNRADLLDKALLRPGRFDRIIEIGLPNVKERMEILELHLKQLKLDGHHSQFQAKLANLTPGMSGADLANICNEAAIYAARQNDECVEEHHLDYAVERVIAGAPRSSTSVSPEERKVVAVHESGHALIGWLLEHTDALAKVTIIPRTKSALGFTRTIPNDRYLHTPEQMFDNMCMLLGGRAAENIVFGRVTQGAQNDLEKVTTMANSQVKYLGFNEKVGNLSFPQNPNPTVKPYSKALEAIMDQEVNLLIKKAYTKAEEVLRNNRSLLDKLAGELFSQETLGYDDIVNIIGPPKYPNKKQVIKVSTGPSS